MCKHRMSSIGFIVSISSLLFLLATSVWARPTTPQEALLAVSGWLANNAEPFGVPLGNQAVDVQTIADETGEPVYYVVRLSPSGFVVAAADDLVEPILSFADGPAYTPTAQDPLTALLAADLNSRLAHAYAAGSSGQLQIQSATQTQEKWGDLIGKASLTQGDFGTLGLETISDVRVAPFLKTQWAQESTCSEYCYNYYTPNHNPAGCVATAMAQLMYYYRCPAAGIGRHSFTIGVLNKEQSAYTLGGDEAGGPYRWTDMVLAPDCSSTVEQRKAIGALCCDAGVSVGTSYAPQGSGADAFAIAGAFMSVFGFSNAISGANNGGDIGTGLAGMINPNLDAQYPVLLGITGASGHAVLADGYGYDLSTRTKTLYHHLNMGWAGYSDVWYNLPTVANYDSVPVCLYNIFTEGTGEIVSGRVTDTAGQPISGVTVGADLRTKRYQAVTNDKGIYALAKLPSAGSFTVGADKSGFTFTQQTVQTGTSQDWRASAGNKWGIDFVGTRTTAGSLGDEDPSNPQPLSDSTPPEPSASTN